MTTSVRDIVVTRQCVLVGTPTLIGGHEGQGQWPAWLTKSA